MDNLKYGVALSGLFGLLGCFLPLGAKTASFWSLRQFSPADSYAVVFALLIAFVVSAVGVVRPPLLRWQAIVAVTAFAFVLIKLRTLLETFLLQGNVGAKLMVVAPVLGLLFGIAAIARPKMVANA